MLKTPLNCIAAALLLAGAASCSTSNSNNPSVNPLTSQAVFTEALLPSNEVPQPTTETTGSGNAVITLHVTTDASGNVTSATIDFVVTLTGFPTTTVITAAHIHEAPAGQAAGVEISTGITSSDVPMTN